MKKLLLISAKLLLSFSVVAQNQLLKTPAFIEKTLDFSDKKEQINQLFATNLQFPEQLLRLSEDYNATIIFTVAQDGQIQDLDVIASLDCKECKKEVFRIMKLMPKWEINNKNESSLPIRYNTEIGISWQKQCYFTTKPYKVAGWTGSPQKVYYPTSKPMISLPKTEQTPASVAEYQSNQLANEIFTTVEQAPEFVGGRKAMLQYIKDNLNNLLLENGKKERVFMKFVVEKDGSIGDVVILKGLGGSYDEEAIRLIKSMPKWKAGTQNDKPVRVYFTMPLDFMTKR